MSPGNTGGWAEPQPTFTGVYGGLMVVCYGIYWVLWDIPAGNDEHFAIENGQKVDLPTH